jgi:hypothetical protein
MTSRTKTTQRTKGRPSPLLSLKSLPSLEDAQRALAAHHPTQFGKGVRGVSTLPSLESLGSRARVVWAACLPMPWRRQAATTSRTRLFRKGGRK